MEEQEAEQETGGTLGAGEVQLYSDGSGIDGKVGSAAVMVKRGQGPIMLRYSLGQLMEHTVYERRHGGDSRPAHA